MKVIPTKKIIPTLYEFFPEKLFNISIKDKYFIIISNHDLTLCDKFYLEKEKEEVYLYIDMISKCSNNGKKNLEKLIEYARKYQLNVKLMDASTIYYNFTTESKEETVCDQSISLRKLKILQTGTTWYQKYGFTNSDMESYKDSITQFINSDIKTILEQEPFHKYKSLIKFFYKRSPFKVNIKIKDFFILTDNILKIVCPDSTCIKKYYIVIKAYSSLIDDIYSLMKDTLSLDNINNTKFILYSKFKSKKK